jgi:preprotein translocase subunit SecF
MKMENNNQEKDGFKFTYSAKEQAEIKRIRDKYKAPTEEEDKMTRLRRLDASVTQTAQAVSLVFGILGVLVLGFGMSLCMTELNNMFDFTKTVAMIVGIASGIFGGALVGCAYPVYKSVAKKMHHKVAPEILHLTGELIK